MMLPSRRHCLVPWARKPHQSVSDLCPGKKTLTSLLFQTPSPVLPIHPRDTLAARPGSCHHCKPSLLPTGALQALSRVQPLERPMLLSQVHVTEGLKSTYSCGNEEKFSWTRFLFCKKCNALSCQQHRALLKMHSP